MRRTSVLVLLVTVGLGVGPQRAAWQPAPSWTSAEANVTYAVAALCEPFVLDRVDPARLPIRQRLVHSDGVSLRARTIRGRIRSGHARGLLFRGLEGDTAKLAENGVGEAIRALFATSEGLELARNFARISRDDLRQQVLRLIGALAVDEA